MQLDPAGASMGMVCLLHRDRFCPVCSGGVHRMFCTSKQERDVFPPRIGLIAACLTLVPYSAPALACGFIESAGNVVTFRQDAVASKIILFGQLENAREAPGGGSTDLVIKKALKTDPALGGRKVVRLPMYIPIPDPKNPPWFLVFGDVANGKLDFFKGVPGKQALLDYVEGVLAIDAADRVKLMRYCFDYLGNENPAIAADAFGEFMKSTDPEIRKAGRTLSPDKLRLWLQDDSMPRERLRLYAFLLANCGSREDAALLRKLLDNLVKQNAPTLIDGVLTGYTLLSPKDGWAYTCELLKNPSAGWFVRYSCLRAARYFHTTQPDVVTEKDILAAVDQALEQQDLADIAVEYLRQWKCWKLTNHVLALTNKKGFDTPTIRRSVLRYALECPDAQVAHFVAGLRDSDSSFVEDVEDGLKAESKR